MPGNRVTAGGPEAGLCHRAQEAVPRFLSLIPAEDRACSLLSPSTGRILVEQPGSSSSWALPITQPHCRALFPGCRPQN